MESVQSIAKNFWDRITAWVQENPRTAAIWAGAIILFLLSFVIRAEPPHVSLAGEPLFSAGPRWLTNSLLTTLIVDIIVIALALLATTRMKLSPSGWQNFVETVIEWLYGLAEAVAASQARRFFPWFATIFFFVIVANWVELVPGVGSVGYYHTPDQNAPSHALIVSDKLAVVNGQLIFAQPQNVPVAQMLQEEAEHHAFVPLLRPPSADLNMTLGVALVVMTLVQIYGVQALGVGYFGKFWNFKGDNVMMRIINGYVGILEIVSELSRIIAFTFRLFGNIFAGEIMLATMAFLITFWLPVPFYALEVFVGLIQAVVFAMLAIIFFMMATISHESHEH